MIEVIKVSKKFGNFTALTDVTCKIDEGCVYGMVGANGAGKSTFLRILTDVYRPDAGEVFIDGEKLFNNPFAKDKIVYVGDELFLFGNSSIERMAGLYQKIYDNFDMEYFNKLVYKFGLDKNKTINIFSKGMKRQLAIILALSTKAKYMFFDETFDGLDPIMRQLVKDLINKAVVENSATAIITSHSLREVEDICDHLALLHKGGMIIDDDIKNLETKHFCVQIAFDYEYGIEKFKGINIKKYSKRGCVANLIIDGNYDEVVRGFREMNPIVMDVLPLSLEEVFTFEMEKMGYKFNAEGN